MNRGYIKLWRKILDNKVLHERGKRFSRLEAWIYLCLKARGLDDPETGLHRGEFRFSIRYLSKAWNWGRGIVERFLRDLEKGPEPMIKRAGQQTGHFEGHFIICNYDTYNITQDSKQDSKQDKVKKVLKKVKRISAIAEELMEDPSYVVFRDSFKKTFDAPYQYQPNDFVRLSRLKKSLELPAGQIPDGWAQTCENYLSTPQATHTLADMCMRYGTFKKSRLDQYGRAVVVEPEPEKQAADSYAEFVTRPDGRKVAVIRQSEKVM